MCGLINEGLVVITLNRVANMFEAVSDKQPKNLYDVIIDSLQSEAQTTWHSLLLEKLNDKKNNAPWGFAISSDDYQELLNWALSKKDESVLSALLSDSFSQDFNEITKMTFINAVRKNETEHAKFLLNNSFYLINNISSLRGKPSMIRHGICGYNLLHLAALNGNTELCQFFIDSPAFTEFKENNDYYGSNYLHYAASSGNKECYDYFLKLNPAWKDQLNIYGHLPTDYFPENIIKLPRCEQQYLIDQLICYKKVDSFDEKNKEVIKGLCAGISPTIGLYILRGEKSLHNYYAMRQMILDWDKTQEGLEKKVDDPEIIKLGLMNTNDVFRYMFSHLLYFQQMQTESNIIDFSRGDLAQQLAFINEGADKFISLFDFGTGEITKDEFEEILENNIIPNRLFRVSLRPRIELGTFSLFTEAHAVTIVVDVNLNIYFCDPNSPYEPIPLAKKDLPYISNILFKYYDNIASVEVFKYMPSVELSKEEMSPVSLKENKNILNSFLICRKGHEYKIMLNACLSDSPLTLRSLLDRSDYKDINDDYFMNLVRKSLSSKSYRCTEILINFYCDKTSSTIEDAYVKFKIAEEDKQHYGNYLVSKM